jgi:pyruvate,water dikinase
MARPVAPTSNTTAEAAAALSRFRRILESNNRIIERIARLEQALGGEYIFDQAFLDSSLDQLSGLVREVIYSLNAISGQRYQGLYQRFTEIINHLADLASGGPGPYDRQLVLPYRLLHRDLDYLVGGKNAVLAEIGNQLQIATPDGFAITATAYHLCLASDGLGARIEAVLAEEGDNGAKAQAISELMQAAELPAELVAAVGEELAALKARQPEAAAVAVRSSAVGEDGIRSFAGQFLSRLDIPPELGPVLAAYRQLLASRFAAPVLDYLGPTARAAEIPMAVAVQTMVAARCAGVLYTRDPARPAAEEMLVGAVFGHGAQLVDGSASADRYLLSRRHPFGLRHSEIIDRSSDPEFIATFAPQEMTSSGRRRGSALLLPEQLRELAEIGLLLEKSFDGPQDLEWGLGPHGMVLLQCRTLALPVAPPPPPEAVAAELKRATVILHGRGQVVQLGIAAGPVVQVTPDTDPTTFPVGSIAVAHQASPRLSPIVRKAAAIITEIGSPTGHLATIAREYRTPALFGVNEACALLPAGREITIDVENREIYAGRIEGLVLSEAAEVDIYLQSEEVRTLRRMLRWIAPLNLIDPAAPDFTVDGCRTLHDLIRFCHEKAMDSLIRLHEEGQLLAAVPSLPLEVAIPIRIRIIDLDGGLARGNLGEEVRPEQVRSRPFAALLAGMLREGFWDREPVPFGFKDLMGSLGRPLTQIVNPPGYSGGNLAIIAADYVNLSLRLGYHFNVIDAFLSEEVEDNYIYFRFVGGFAEEHKRCRRLDLLAMILASLHFKVERQGDLLIGKAKILSPAEMTETLTRLGELVAFSRQLDVRMGEDGAVDNYYQLFLEQVRGETGAGSSHA